MRDPLKDYELRGKQKILNVSNMVKIPLKDTSEKSKNQRFFQIFFKKIRNFFLPPKDP